MSACGCAEPFVGLSIAGTYAGNASLLFMTLLNTLIRDKCNVSQVCERVRPKTEPDDSYDFIIVGGGSTGSVVAGRLAELSDWKVLVVEAGDDEPVGNQVPSLLSNFIGDPRLGWVYKLEPEPEACLGNEEGRCSWPRAKVLGGCGVINGMMYARGMELYYLYVSFWIFVLMYAILYLIFSLVPFQVLKPTMITGQLWVTPAGVMRIFCQFSKNLKITCRLESL